MQAFRTSCCKFNTSQELTKEKTILHTVWQQQKIFISGNHRKCLLQIKLKRQVLSIDEDYPKIEEGKKPF